MNNFKMKKSKKGDIPITILVIGVVAICALAIGSFLISGFNFEKKFYGLSSVQEMNVMIEDYHFYKEQGLATESIENILDIKTSSNGKKYLELNQTSPKYVITNVAYGQGFKVNEFVFSVRYNLP